MTRFSGVLLIVLAGLGAWLALPLLLLPSGTSIISRWHAEDANQCLAEPVLRRDDYWVPSPEQIAELESELSRVMFEREKAGQTVPYPGQRYNGEYLGFARAGRRYIYANYFPSYMADEERWTLDAPLLGRPHCVADGGRHFWNVFYEPETKTFDRVTFNGPS